MDGIALDKIDAAALPVLRVMGTVVVDHPAGKIAQFDRHGRLRLWTVAEKRLGPAAAVAVIALGELPAFIGPSVVEGDAPRGALRRQFLGKFDVPRQRLLARHA